MRSLLSPKTSSTQETPHVAQESHSPLRRKANAAQQKSSAFCDFSALLNEIERALGRFFL